MRPAVPRTIRAVLACLLLPTAMAAARAESITLAGRHLDLPVPPGYCTTREDGAEGRVAARIRHGIGDRTRLLLLFVHCDELRTMRAAKPDEAADGFDDYGTITTPVRDGEVRVIDQYDRAQFIQVLAKTLANGEVVSDGLKRAEARVRDLRDIREMQSLGVLGTDANAVYLGLTALNAETHQRVLAVAGATLVKSINVYVNLYTTLKAPDDVGRMLTQQKANLAVLVSTNR